MEFHSQNKDGPARIGCLTFDKKTVMTPTFLFLHTARLRAPDFSDVLLTQGRMKTNKPTIRIGESVFSKRTKKRHGDFAIEDYLIYPRDAPTELHRCAQHVNKNNEYCIVPAKKELLPNLLQDNDATFFIVSDALQLYSQQTQCVEFITTLRHTIGYNKVLYLPCVGDPSSIALLTFMGVDLFDSCSAIRAARNDMLLFPTGVHTKNDLIELPCGCPACSKNNDVKTMGFDEILQHNYHMLSYEIKEVRNAIIAGSLRELVEIRVRSSPHLSSLLRLLDLNHYLFLEERIPIVRKHPLIATTKDSLQRPEIRRFQERVIQRFEKPASTKILLLLPCSAKKPYSFSKSHALFRECLRQQANQSIVHEVILTSPLGLVPRELELTYPASSYDTAVTGHWDEDEKTMIRTLLMAYLHNNRYDATIMHIPLSMQSFVRDLVTNPLITCKDSPTSVESLTELSQVLSMTTQKYPRVNPHRREWENITALARFQFGQVLAELLMKDCTISGKYPYQKIMDRNIQLGMVTEGRGLISLTMAGAERLAETKHYWVEIDDDVPLKGSVLAPGVKEADDSIRIGDEVLVRKNKHLCGVGVASMNGNEMTQSVFGEAVKLRHHR